MPEISVARLRRAAAGASGRAPSVIYIAGSGRSGGTLLERVLGEPPFRANVARYGACYAEFYSAIPADAGAAFAVGASKWPVDVTRMRYGAFVYQPRQAIEKALAGAGGE